MKRTILLMLLAIAVLLCSCTSIGPVEQKKPDTVYVRTAEELQNAVKNKAKTVVLMNNIDLSLYTPDKPYVLRGGNFTIDLNGYTISGLSSVTGDITNYEQANYCNFVIKGFMFTLKNGNLDCGINGGYVLMINDTTPVQKASYNGIVLENITTNGGIDVNYSSIRFVDCHILQPVRCTKNYASIVLHHSNCVLESGSYSNQATNKYQRFLKILYSDCLIKNGVEYEGSIQYVITSSTLNLEK